MNTFKHTADKCTGNYRTKDCDKAKCHPHLRANCEKLHQTIYRGCAENVKRKKKTRSEGYLCYNHSKLYQEDNRINIEDRGKIGSAKEDSGSRY